MVGELARMAPAQQAVARARTRTVPTQTSTELGPAVRGATGPDRSGGGGYRFMMRHLRARPSLIAFTISRRLQSCSPSGQTLTSQRRTPIVPNTMSLWCYQR